jgi:hypothetical protein
MLEFYESKKNKPTEIIPKTGESIGGPGHPIETKVIAEAKKSDVTVNYNSNLIFIKKGIYTIDEITAELEKQLSVSSKTKQYEAAWGLIRQFDQIDFNSDYAVEEWAAEIQLLISQNPNDSPLTREVIKKFNQKLKEYNYTCFDENLFPEEAR